MIVTGIDCGKLGCVVHVDTDSGEVLVLPSWAEYVTAKEYQPALMLGSLVRWGRPSLVAIEKQHSMPRMGSTSALTTGFGFGLWVGLCTGIGAPYRIVRAVDWQRGIGVERTKDKAQIKARVQAQVAALLPSLDMPRARAKREAVADAAGIALWARMEARG
ncbi:hypothetical protein H8E07_13350 [bacterium]|nr:hypothetical protein [bacterium]